MSNESSIERIIKEFEWFGIRDPVKESVRCVLEEFEKSDFDYNTLCPNLSTVIEFIIETILSIGEQDSEHEIKYLNIILSIMKTHEHLFQFPDSDPEASLPRIQFSVKYFTQLLNLTQIEACDKFHQLLQQGLIHFLTIHQTSNRGRGADFNLDEFNYVLLLFYLQNTISSLINIEDDKDLPPPSLTLKQIEIRDNTIFNQNLAQLSENYQSQVKKLLLSHVELNQFVETKTSLHSTFKTVSEVISQTMIKSSEPSRLTYLYNIYLQFSFKVNNQQNSLIFNICTAQNLKILNLLTLPQNYNYHSLLNYLSYLKIFLKENFNTGFKIGERLEALNLINKNIENWTKFLNSDKSYFNEAIISLFPNLEEILLCPSFTFITIQIQKSFIKLITLFFDNLPANHNINEKILSTLLELSLEKDLMLVGFEAFIKYYKLALKALPSYDMMAPSGLGRRERSYCDNFMNVASKRFKSSYDTFSASVPGSPNSIFGNPDVDAITELYNELPNTFEFGIISQLVRLFIDFFIECEQREFIIDIDHIIILKRLILASLVDQPKKSNVFKYIDRLLDIYFKFVTKLYVKVLSKNLTIESSRKDNVISLYYQTIQIANYVSLQNSPTKSTLLLTLIPFIRNIYSPEFYQFYQSLTKAGVLPGDFNLNKKLKEISKTLDNYHLLVEDFQNLPTTEICPLSLITLCNQNWQLTDEDNSDLSDSLLVVAFLAFIPFSSSNNFNSEVLNTWWKNLFLILNQVKYKGEYLSFLTNQIEISSNINLNNIHPNSILTGLKEICCAWDKTLKLSNLDSFPQLSNNAEEFKILFKLRCEICTPTKSFKRPTNRESIDSYFVKLLGLVDYYNLLPVDKLEFIKLIEVYSKHSTNLENLIEDETLVEIFINLVEEGKGNTPLLISKIFIPIFNNPSKPSNSRFTNRILDLIGNRIEIEPNSNSLEVYIKCVGCIISGIEFDLMLPLMILLLKAFQRSEINLVQLVSLQFKLLFSKRKISQPFSLINQFLPEINHNLIEIFNQPNDNWILLSILFKINPQEFILYALPHCVPLTLDKYSTENIDNLLVLANIEKEEVWDYMGAQIINYFIVNYNSSLSSENWVVRLIKAYSIIGNLQLEDIRSKLFKELSYILNDLIFNYYQSNSGKESDHELLDRVKSVYLIIFECLECENSDILVFLKNFFPSSLTFAYDYCKLDSNLKAKRQGYLINLKKLILILGPEVEAYFYQICSLYSELSKVESLQHSLLQILDNLPKLFKFNKFINYSNHFISIIYASLPNITNSDIKHKLIFIILDLVKKRRKFGELGDGKVNWLPCFSSEFEELRKLQVSSLEAIIDKGPDKVISYYINIIEENTILSCETGLNGLWDYISNNDNFVQNYLGEAPLPGFINRLFITLFNIFHDDLEITESSKSLAAKILGKLGATDLDLLVNNEVNFELPLILNTSRARDWIPFFKSLLGKILIPKFQSSLSFKNQLAYSYGIQQILKILDFRKLLKITSEDDVNDEAQELVNSWKHLTEGNELIMGSLLKSEYNVKTTDYIQSTPINLKCETFEHWLSNWYQIIISKLDPNTYEYQLFNSLVGIVQIPDIQLLTTVFPQLIFHTIKKGNKEALESIIIELRSVFDNAIKFRSKEDKTYIKYNTSLKFILKLFSSLENIISLIKDYFSKWYQEHKTNPHLGNIENLKNTLELYIQSIQKLIQCIPKNVLGKASLMVDDLASSMRSLEYYRRESINTLTEQESKEVLSELEGVFCRMSDRDSVIGISRSLGDKSDDLRIKDYLYLEDWQSVQAWYDAALQKDPTNPDYKLGLIEACRIQGLHLVVESLYDSFTSTDIPTELKLKMEDCALESSWKKVNLQRLNNYNLNSLSNTFNSSLGKIMILINLGKYSEVLNLIELTRANLIPKMGFMGGNFFQGLSSSLIQLHMLDDVEFMIKNCSLEGLNLEQVSKYWKAKLNHTHPTFKYRESILSLSRSLTQLTQPLTSPLISTNVIDELYINSIKSARHAEYISIAQSMMPHISKDKQWEVQIQEAKCKWYFGEKPKAIQILENALNMSNLKTPTSSEIQKYSQSPQKSQFVNKNNPYYPWAKLKLLWTKWLHEISGKQPISLRSGLSDICSIFPNFAKAMYNLSQLSIDITHEALANQKQHSQLELINLTISSIMHSSDTLSNYPQYNQLILPRIINLVIEIATHFIKNPPNQDQKQTNLKLHHDSIFQHFNRLINMLNSKSLFYVFNQAACGICHDSELLSKCFIMLSKKVLYNYPHQSLWNLAPMLLSADKVKKQKAYSIVKASTLEDNIQTNSQQGLDLITLFKQYSKLWEFLEKLSKSQDELQSLAYSSGWNYEKLGLLIPLQSTLTSPEVLDTAPRIKSIDKRSIKVMSSLARPIKFSFITDGNQQKLINFLCKPNDDLRKDARVMEFNSMLNRLFELEVESRKRNLLIKTYAVLALGSNYGIIEWVENTLTLKSSITAYHQRAKPPVNLRKHGDNILKLRSKSEKAQYLVDKVLPSYPITLHKWYYDHFPDPKKWYSARLNYSRSLAVMSMVGYILGLGDRHSENIMIDVPTGNILHIDYNCIFEGGKSLQVPEVVPFRLTRNLEDCLGPSGVEGPFRISCEVTMAICRKYHKTLYSVLQSFLTDPLVEWGKVKQQSNVYNLSKKDYVNNKATEFLDPIKLKLKGMETSTSPILVSQQVQALITEATDIGNLASMFIGWGSYY